MTLRRALAVVLCLLLLSLQSQALVHPLAHAGYGKAQETGLASTVVDATCAQCTLLAGTAAVAGHAASSSAGDVADVVAARFDSRRTTGSPAWFRSRAPPIPFV